MPPNGGLRNISRAGLQLLGWPAGKAGPDTFMYLVEGEKFHTNEESMIAGMSQLPGCRCLPLASNQNLNHEACRTWVIVDLLRYDMGRGYGNSAR